MLSTRPNMCANRNRRWSARCPLNARPNSFCCVTRIGGVDLRYGSTADQGRTGRKDSSSRLWRPAPAPGTHAKQSPSTGHSAVGLRQGGEMSPDAEATFHRAACTLGNQVVGASDGPPFRQECRPTRLCRTPGPVAVCVPKQASAGNQFVIPRRGWDLRQVNGIERDCGIDNFGTDGQHGGRDGDGFSSRTNALQVRTECACSTMDFELNGRRITPPDFLSTVR
jgi:hypothetical protein